MRILGMFERWGWICTVLVDLSTWCVPGDDVPHVHAGQLICVGLAVHEGGDGSLVYGGHRGE